MIIRNPEVLKVKCYKVNKKLSDYLINEKLLPLFAMDGNGGYYFIYNENITKAIGNMPYYKGLFTRYEIVDREVKEVGK